MDKGILKFYVHPEMTEEGLCYITEMWVMEKGTWEWKTLGTYYYKTRSKVYEALRKMKGWEILEVPGRL